MPYCYGNGGGYGRFLERREQQLATPKEGRRAVVCVDTGEVYLSCNAAAQVMGGNSYMRESIRQCCNHERPEAYGLRWEWSEPGKLYQAKS